VAVGETVDSNKGVAGQTRTLERAGSRPTNQVSHLEKENGICPSCGHGKEHVADRYCDLCTQARQDEEAEGPHDTPLGRMARGIGARDDYRRHD
jgi:hypothetical protein